MRCLIRQYNRLYEQVFPMGRAPSVSVQGTYPSFPTSCEEFNNRNFKGYVDTRA